MNAGSGRPLRNASNGAGFWPRRKNFNSPISGPELIRAYLNCLDRHAPVVPRRESSRGPDAKSTRTPTHFLAKVSWWYR